MKRVKLKKIYASSDAISLLDPEGRILHCNEAMGKLMGKALSDIIGHTCCEVVHSSSEHVEGCPLVRMRETRRKQNLALPVAGRCFEVTVDPLLDEHGSIIGATHVMSDITERKEANGEFVKQTDDLHRINRMLEEKNRLLEVFRKIGQQTLSSLDLEQILDNLAGNIVKAGVFPSLMIALVDKQNHSVEVVRNLTYRVVDGTVVPYFRACDRRVVGISYDLTDTNITAEVAREGEMRVMEEWDDRFDARFDKPEYRKNRVSYFIPIKHGDRVLAVVATGSSIEEKEEILRRIQIMSPLLDQVAIALEHAELYRTLGESEKKYRLLSENIPVVVYSVLSDKQSRNLFVSERIEELTGYSREQFLEVPGLWATILHPEDRRYVWEKIEEHFEERIPLDVEYRIITRDNVIKWIRNRATPIFDENCQIIRIDGFMEDITDRRNVEEELLSYQNQLRSLASKLSLAEEQERRRIATELHDRISQTLAISKLKLGALLESTPSSDFEETLREIHDLIGQTFRDTRSLMLDLSPPLLYELGLEPAVLWLVEQTSERHGMPIDFEDDEQFKPLSEDIKIVLFQAVRELLTNIVKHAQATSAKVSIRKDDQIIEISLEDNGVGFDISKTALRTDEAGGFGLFNIRERLSHFGGDLKIESVHGEGTKVTLVAPLESNTENPGRKSE